MEHQGKKEESGFWDEANPLREVPEDTIRSATMGVAQKFFMIFAVVVLFILALQIIKIAVSSTSGDIFTDYVNTLVSNPWKAFSIGWLGTVSLFSGSPMASLGVSLFSVGAFSTTHLTFLIMGSRGGPDLVLFVVGLITYITKRNIRHTLGLGLVEFLTTLSTIIGMAILNPFIFNSQWNLALAQYFEGTAAYADFISTYFEPVSRFIVSQFSPSLSIIVGIAILMMAIFLFDRFFKFMNFREEKDSEVHAGLKEYVTEFRQHPFKTFQTGFLGIVRSPVRLVSVFRKKTFSEKARMKFKNVLQNPFFAFLMGLLITGITMSTAVSVGILVPFYAYRVITIRSVVPYVLAANISTFLDTLFVAILTGNLEAVRVVTGLILSAVIFVSLVGVFFKYYLYIIGSISQFIFERPWRLVALILLAIIVPVGIVVV